MDFMLSPEEQQMILAQKLRGEQALAQSAAQGNRFNNMAAISQLANNPAAAAASKQAMLSAQAANKPDQLGAQGYFVPGQGFVESPMYTGDKLQQRKLQQGMTQDRLLQAAQLQQERLAAQAQQGEQNRALRLAIAQMLEGGRSSRAADAAAGKEAKAAKGKVLPGSEVRKLSGKEGVASAFGELTGGYKDEFAGTPGAAGLENIIGKYQPLGMGKGLADQSNWWQNYNDQKNAIRHELFGSALTAPEKAAFDAANINEGMDPKEIRRRLSQQHQAAVRAYNKLKGNYGKAGYDVGEFNDIAEPEDVPLPGRQANPGNPDDALINKYLK